MTTFNNFSTIEDLLNIKIAKNIKLFSDLDGVIVAFDKEFEKLGHGTIEEFELRHPHPAALWNFISTHSDHFWLNMEWVPDGKELWNFIKKYNPTLLTTPAQSVPHCVEDKQAWVKRELGNYNVIISGHKYKYATPGAILIDDMEKNIIPWNEAGGIGILHINATNTIAALTKIIA
jgi:hypothetical protein